MMKDATLTDAQLVAQYKNGDEKAFNTLLERYKSRVFTTIYLIVRDKCVAEDLMQDSFIKAIDRIQNGTYNETGKFGPWIVRIGHNLAIDYFRRQKRYPMVTTEDGTGVFNTVEFTEASIEASKIKEDTHTKLREMIQNLPPAQKEVLIMRHYAEMSFQDIANQTGVSINTALGRMRYALINLRKQLKGANLRYS